MTHDHQKLYHRAWSQLGPPLRPPADVVAAIREQIKGKVGRALDLLADGGNDVGGRPQWRSELRPRAM